ncbi:exopolyphosphatase / guanosine-5'-triphosphate,3'-diphosphate pyrophosphatase [uncultured Gammaproteobacteria bacterium]
MTLPPTTLPPTTPAVSAPVHSGERVAVIDIGSNSIRLVVYDHPGRAPLPLVNEKVLCGLGRGLEKTGRLDAAGVRLALANLTRFRFLIDGMAVSRIDVLATAAVREAADGADFVNEVAARTGLVVRTIPGEEEARLSAMGVLSGIPGANGVMGDMGGGSLEMVVLKGAEIEAGGDPIGERVTLPLGALRLIEASGNRQPEAVKIIDKHLDRLPWLPACKGRNFYPVGGDWRALAILHMERSNYPLHIVHQYAPEPGEFLDFVQWITRQNRSTLEKLVQRSRRRVDTLPMAALVLERVLRATEPTAVVLSAFGLREGHSFDLMSPEQRRVDPLVSNCLDLVGRLGRFGINRDVERVFNWTSGLFPAETEAERRLRYVTCILGDLNWSEHPDYRAEHTYLHVLRLPFVGMEHGDRAFLALVSYVRYGERTDDAAVAIARRLLKPEQLNRAVILGLALRLAYTLCGGVATILDGTALDLAPRKLVLSLPAEKAALGGEVVGRRLEALAKALGGTGELVAIPAKAV